MKICKSFHPIKSYECGDGSLKLNLFNGSYTYSYPLLSIGRNSFSISISLVYNSTYNSSDFGGRLIGFGNGWKLDIEQHLFPYIETYNINGFNFRNYVYIDANWSIHRFVHYKTLYNGDITTDYYYDDSGTGLIMKKCGDSLLIEDEYSNQYIFENGRLVEIISSVNIDIRKIIEYNNNYITSYYDVRKQNRKISFNYSGSALISINNTLNAQSYSINYDVDKIIEFVSTNQSTSKSIHKFIYNNDKIEYVVNSIDLEALKLVYSNTNELFSISSGAMKPIVDTQEDNAEIYCGSESYVGEGDYVTNTALTNKGIVYSMPTNYINTVNQYVYHISSTEETNKFGIVIIHSFDVDGRLLCSLENKEQNNYCSLEKTIGRIISEEGQSSIHFNGKKVKELNSSNNYSYWIFDDCDSCLFTNFLHTLNESSDLHTLSFYIMFSNDNASDQIIDIDCHFENTDDNFTKQAIISKVKGNSWQKVEIPLNFNRKQMSLIAINISLHNTTIGIAYISEVMIKEGGVSGIYIDNLLNNSFKEIKVGSIIYLDSNLYTISPSFYVTKNDLFATYKSLFLEGANNGRYNFYCNNKTRIIGVVDTSLDSHNNPNYSFEINNGIPNFHFALADYLDKFEDQNSTLHTRYLLNEEQYRFHVDGNKYYYELKQSTGVINDYNYNERITDSNAKYNLSYLWVNSDGAERARKSVRFLNNNEIHTVTHIYYDEYGNRIQTKTYDDNNLIGENITNSYSYSTDKELLTSINENGIISNIFYDNILNIDYIVTSNLKKKFNYGDDNQIESIDFINKNTGIKLSTNMIVKDKHERISILKDTSGNSCGFLYNGIGDICRLTVNNRINTLFKKNELNNNSCYQSKTYKQSNQIVESESVYNKYDNVISNRIGDHYNNYTFENNSYSGYIQRIVQINDSLNDDVISFTYDDINGVESKTINSDFKVEKANFYTNYNITSDTEKYNILSDTISSINSRNIILVNNSIQKSNEYKALINDFTFTYEADNLGRLSSVKGNQINELNALIKVDKEITYVPNTILPNKLKYDITSEISNNLYNANFTFENEYTNGNITKFKEYGNRFVENPYSVNNTLISSLISKEYQYSYDEVDRLTSEALILSNDLNNMSVTSYEYGSVSNMIERVIKDNITIKQFTYNNGRISSYIMNNVSYNISYDNYGNIIAIGNRLFTYNSQNLLSNIIDDNHNYTYTYNYEGVRNSKTIDNTIIKYHLDGTKIIGEDWYENNSPSITKKIRYFYDAEGICGLKYDGCYFKLIKDSLGNVNKVMYQGKIIGGYVYDAWGNVSVNPISIDSDPINGARDTFVLYNNPFRYKGYYYDNESQMYYCNSRYYTSELYQWISPNSIEFLDFNCFNGLNAYLYCYHNPTKCSSRGDLIDSSLRKTNIYRAFSSNDIQKNKKAQDRYKPNINTSSILTANIVSRSSYSTTIVDNVLIGMLLGNISHTITIQYNNSQLLYAYSNIGNRTDSFGIGFNINNWYGSNIYVSSNIGIGSSVQITPYITIGEEVSFRDGVSFSIGTISGNVTNEITVSIGWGTLAFAYVACGAIATIPVPFARAVAGVALCIVLLIDVLN